jgi:Restriction endonuclease
MKTAYFIADNEESISAYILNSLLNNNIGICASLFQKHDHCKNDHNDDVLTSIRRSKIVLVFCDRFTNNMAVEIGMAIALEKKIFIFSDFVNDIPYVLKDYAIFSSHNNYDSCLDKILHAVNDSGIEETENIPSTLLERYAANNDMIYQVDGKDFEEMVYQLLTANNKSVIRDIYSNDGYDMVVNDGNTEFIVEAKKFNKNAKVSLNYIQQFFGILSAIKAEKGLFISNVEYTNSALEFSKMLHGKIELFTFADLYKKFATKSKTASKKIGSRSKQTLNK